LGGIVAGLLGPEIGKQAKDWFGLQEYVAPFLILGGIYLLVVLILMLYQENPVTVAESDDQQPERSLWEIITQPLFITAFMSATVAYGSMTLLMTATPLSMHVMDHFSLDDTARVIQGHVLGMFVPSFFTGNLIQRFGVYRVLVAGVAILIVCSLIGIWDRSFLHYWTALVLLGVGWNFLFIGGTTLLAQSYRPSESFKVQAFNDFGVFSLQFLAASSAGFIIFHTSWTTINLLVTPVCAALLIRYIWVTRGRPVTSTS
jgi:MFS family permease